MLSPKHPEKGTKLRPDKPGKVCCFYYKKYSKRLIYYLTLSFGLIYYKQSLYLPTTTMAKKMEASYKKLWKLLIDRDMSKTDLRLKAGISTMALAKLGKNENVSMEVLKKVCKALECNIGDIMDLVPGKDEKFQ